MGWLKAVYEWVGVPYPKLSLAVVTILGAVTAFGVWSFMGRLVAKDQAVTIPSIPSVPPQISGPASTSGNESPAVTGNGNNINYGEPSPDGKPPKKD